MLEESLLPPKCSSDGLIISGGTTDTVARDEPVRLLRRRRPSRSSRGSALIDRGIPTQPLGHGTPRQHGGGFKARLRSPYLRLLLEMREQREAAERDRHAQGADGAGDVGEAGEFVQQEAADELRE